MKPCLPWIRSINIVTKYPRLRPQLGQRYWQTIGLVIGLNLFGQVLPAVAGGTNFCQSPYGEIYGTFAPRSIYTIHAPTGASALLTTSTFTNVAAINGMATDHVNKLVYYGDANSLYAWNALTNTHIQITSDFKSLVPSSYTYGLTTLSSGGAAFYNGSLYVGVDGRGVGNALGSNPHFEIFKVDFVAGSNGQTIQAVTPLDIAGNSAGGLDRINEDWGDFTISDTGIILAMTNRYDALNNNTPHLWNYNLNNNTYTNIGAPIGNHQIAKSGDGKLWAMFSSGSVQEMSATGTYIGTAKTTIAVSDAGECVVGNSTVGDRVWSDLNGNGVQDTGEPGISGVSVSIYRDINKDRVLAATDPLLATQTTDANGNYNFTELLPHDAAVGAGHNDFIVQVTGGIPAGYIPPLLTKQAVDLSSASQTVSTVDFGYKLLTISGTVWNDANNSAAGTFTNIFTAGETGTNAGGLNAVLVSSTGIVIATTPVAANGTYTFTSIAASQNNVSIRLSTTPGTVGSTAPTASLPTSWLNTSPLTQTAFNIALVNITTKDFGIRPDPIVVVPTGTLCQAAGGTAGFNQVTSEFGGTFGTLASGYRNLQTPPAGYGYRNTGFIYGGVNYGVLVEAAVYTVTSQPGSGPNLNVFGPWRAATGVNTGLANDAYLAVNGDVAVGYFVTQTIAVQPNTNYEFGLWAMNVHPTTSAYGGSGQEANVGIEIVDSDGLEITTTETGLLVKGDPWKRGSVLFNSGNRTSVTLKMRNVTTTALGNDFYIDGMFAAQCSNLPVGNVTGTVYQDKNGNGAQNSGELGVAGVTVTLKDKNGVPVTTTTDSTGQYSFTNIPGIASLQSYSVTVDGTSTPVATWTSTTPTSTSGVNITVGGVVSGGNFGFKGNNANILLVKRITAINGDRTKNPNDNTPLNVFIDDPLTHDNNANWPTPTSGTPPISNFLAGVIDAGKVKPSDTIEYTIYFLNAGGSNANNVRVCDRIIDSQKILSGSPVLLQKNSATPTILTSNADTDRATFYASSSDPVITNCNFTGTPTIDNGAIVVDVTGATGSPTWTTLPGSTGAGTTDTYGFVRFTTKVNP